MHFKVLNRSLVLLIIQLVLILGVIYNPLYAQEPKSIGINVGATYSGFRGNDFFEDYKYGLDFLIGVSYGLELSERLDVFAELNYERKSTQRIYEQSYIDENGNVTIIGNPIGSPSSERPEFKFQSRFDYLTLPVSIKYYFSKKRTFYINTGAFVGLLLNQKNIDDGEDAELFLNPQFDTIDYGIVLGVGYDIYIDDYNTMSITLRNALGFNDIDNFGKQSPYHTTRSNSLNLILTWNFLFKSQYEDSF
jgi:hypothetical protein